jgi:hypothetical protein
LVSLGVLSTAQRFVDEISGRDESSERGDLVIAIAAALASVVRMTVLEAFENNSETSRTGSGAGAVHMNVDVAKVGAATVIDWTSATSLFDHIGEFSFFTTSGAGVVHKSPVSRLGAEAGARGFDLTANLEEGIKDSHTVGSGCGKPTTSGLA